ncbi:hypothetical protein DE146DRAFT_790739 [Phaeosphaeria sp. MPI-PUGE-AT-0046c]|nr:hypothetical protein DE146DRAFT_790739 [Phaeosphaeria sp. MPI-PUGE-AT-0046c]
MAKESTKTNHATSLQRRQVNGTNEIVKSNSLQSRMIATKATKQEIHVPKEPSRSPGKRKRQMNKRFSGDQIDGRSQKPTAKSDRRKNNNNNSNNNKVIADPEIPIHCGEPEAKKPRLWQHIKPKKLDISESAPGTTDKQRPETDKSNVKDDKSAETLRPCPSPLAMEPSSTSKKRNADDALGEATEHKGKKLRPYVIEKTTKQVVEKAARLQPVDPATAKRRQTCTKPSAPVVTNPNCEHIYKEYSDDSIPILYAAHNSGDRPNTLLNRPSLDLKCRALAMLENPKGFSANDLGRPTVEKTGRTKIIDDLDLYLMEDHNIHVATERGLLLVADYLKLSGVPDSTAVRFNGTKPPYVKLSTDKRYFRWVSTTTFDPTADVWDRPILPTGDLPLLFGEMVEIWERDPNTGRVFGKCIHGGQTGWFDLENTVGTRKELPPIEPWDDTVFEDKDFTFSKNDPPAPPAALASLKYVKTYRCSQVAAPPGAILAPISAAIHTTASYTPSKPANSQSSIQPSSTPKSRKAQKQEKDIGTTTEGQVEDPRKFHENGRNPALAMEDRTKSMDFFSSEAAPSKVGTVENLVHKDSRTIWQHEATTVGEKADTPTLRKVEVANQDLETEINTTSKATSNTSLVQRSMHDHSVEDEVDWDYDEL